MSRYNLDEEIRAQADNNNRDYGLEDAVNMALGGIGEPNAGATFELEYDFFIKI